MLDDFSFLLYHFPVPSSGAARSSFHPSAVVSGRSAVWLAHLLWEQGVEGSNPFAPTMLRWICGNSSIGRALAFQAGGCGFESRFPLHFFFAPVAQLDRATAF